MQTQALDNCLKEIRKDSGISTLNEEDAKRRITILGLLQEIKAEHGVGRRVDYALQQWENKVFIEAKKRERRQSSATPRLFLSRRRGFRGGSTFPCRVLADFIS